MPRPITILPDPPPPPAAIGLIAGGGRLPVLVANGLRAVGHTVHGLGLARQYDADLPALCHSFHDVGLLRLGSWTRILGRLGVHHAVMVGGVDKTRLLHDRWRVLRNLPDFRTVLAWHKHVRHDRRSHVVLGMVATELDRSGIQLIDSTIPIPDQLCTPGTLTSTRPTPDQQADIAFVWPLLTEILRLDIGQAVAVRDRDVIAVEAAEGTDRMIERVGQLCRAGGWTLCKGARAGHDRRADVPTIGIKTIENLHRHGGRCLALASGDVIMIDKPRVIEAADRMGISIVGVVPGSV